MEELTQLLQDMPPGYSHIFDGPDHLGGSSFPITVQKEEEHPPGEEEHLDGFEGHVFKVDSLLGEEPLMPLYFKGEEEFLFWLFEGDSNE